MKRIEEKELELPTLKIIRDNPGIKTANIRKELEKTMIISPKDLEILSGRNDTYFSQKVRNICGSHYDTRLIKYTNRIKDGGVNKFHLNQNGKNYLDNLQSEELEEEIEEQKFIQEINNENIAIDDVSAENNRIPELLSITNGSQKYKRSKKVSRKAIENANFKCEYGKLIGENHITFQNLSNNNYVEGHHLIPLQKGQKDFKNINIDREENIVSLCPICHSAIHYGNKDVKIEYLKVLFEKREEELKKVNINIEFNMLMNKYYL